MNHSDIINQLKPGDPVIYHRLGTDMHCEFLCFATDHGRRFAVVWHETDGRFHAPLSQLSAKPKIQRVM